MFNHIGETLYHVFITTLKFRTHKVLDRSGEDKNDKCGLFVNVGSSAYVL